MSETTGIHQIEMFELTSDAKLRYVLVEDASGEKWEMPFDAKLYTDSAALHEILTMVNFYSLSELYTVKFSNTPFSPSVAKAPYWSDDAQEARIEASVAKDPKICSLGCEDEDCQVTGYCDQCEGDCAQRADASDSCDKCGSAKVMNYDLTKLRCPICF